MCINNTQLANQQANAAPSHNSTNQHTDIKKKHTPKTQKGQKPLHLCGVYTSRLNTCLTNVIKFIERAERRAIPSATKNRNRTQRD